MSDFDGGFVIARADDGVGAIAYRVVRDYLARVGEACDGRDIAYATERDVDALWLMVTGGPADGKGRMLWHESHAALAGELAGALSCPAWAWGREDQVGTEFVVAFDAAGREIAVRRVGWDDTGKESASPIEALAVELGAWEVFENGPGAQQPLDEPFDPEELSLYLLAFKPKPRPTGRTKLTVFLTRNVLDDATKLAKATETDLGTVVWAAWEAVKTDLIQKSPSPTDETLLALPPGEAPAAFTPPKKKPPALSGKTNSTADMIELFVPSSVDKEIRALAVHADVKYGRVVDYAYVLARESLWKGG